ncbi:peptidoglycan editing factor PgeF [Coralliovum pocilloporae]|uniref:peptidoglycan editing factor PgeF n=1 Tax=Coralliovum pocilloporae TaxID=3066369 RepID=UPI0033075E21
MIEADSLKTASGTIRHGFFTRQNGQSTGLYHSRNCGLGSGDERETVVKNRESVALALGVDGDSLATPYQIHGITVHVADGPVAEEARPKADAIVTKTPGLAIGIVTADCGPVLFADPDAQIVGAAHAGWKGASSGVLEATIDTMVAQGAERHRITAVLGPTISQRNYEVGPEFVERLLTLDEDNSAFFIPSTRADHAMFDLPGYILSRLRGCGLASATATGHCTYEDETAFFSYRRATHRSEPDYGRQISAIALQ